MLPEYTPENTAFVEHVRRNVGSFLGSPDHVYKQETRLEPRTRGVESLSIDENLPENQEQADLYRNGYVVWSKDSEGLYRALLNEGILLRYNSRAARVEYYPDYPCNSEGMHDLRFCYLRDPDRDIADMADAASPKWTEVTDRIEAQWQELLTDKYKHAQDYKGKMRLVPLRFGADTWKRAFLALQNRVEHDPFVKWLEQAGREWPENHVFPGLLQYWLSDLFGCDDTDINLWASEYLFLGAIQRAYEPGARLKTMPVLVGKQGWGKSPVLANMFPLGSRFEWFSDGLNLGDNPKERVEALQRRVLVEVQEMAGSTRAELQSLKAFLSRVDDGSTRLAYRRNAETALRRCILVGTADRNDFLPNDPSGNTRFVPVQLKHGANVEAYMQKNRMKLWMTALWRYRDGARADFPRELRDDQKELTDAYRNRDDTLEDKIELLEHPGPLTLNELADKIEVDVVDMRMQKRVGAALTNCGWRKEQRRIDGRKGVYWIRN